ncbi:O-antigen ligase family protein [Patescibacteria group bacterium]|nr:O-antigen ligase family protein [Patescibacteria group bacterium]
MIETLLLIFISLSPLFGKNLDYLESLVFYGVPIFIYLLLLSFPKKLHRLPLSLIVTQAILIILYAFSTFLSVDIGISYYHLFQFLNLFFILDLCLVIFPNTTQFEKILTFSTLSLVIIFFLNYFHFITLPDKPLGDNFLKQVWGHSYLSELLIITIPISLKCTLQYSRRYLPIFLSLLLALFFTHSRIAILATSISLTIVILALKNTLVKFRLFLLLPLLFVALLGTVYLVSRGALVNKTLDGTRPEYWSQAWRYFLESPIIGNGPGTFETANNKFHQSATAKSSLAHSSLLTFLSENGLLFTLVISLFILSSLLKVSRTDPFIFSALAASAAASLLDPSWNTLGIFLIVLTLVMLYQPNPPPGSSNRLSAGFILLEAICLSLFFLSKTASDLLFLSHHYALSQSLDPFNPNPRLALIKSNPQNNQLINSTIYLFKGDEAILGQLADILPPTQSESLQTRLIALDPVDSIKPYLSLLRLYQETHNLAQFQATLDLFNRNIGTKTDMLISPISIVLYQEALSLWPQDKPQALHYLQTAVNYTPDWSHLRIELANAYTDNHQTDLANQEITACLARSVPSFHCQQYITSTALGHFGTLNRQIISASP